MKTLPLASEIIERLENWSADMMMKDYGAIMHKDTNLDNSAPITYRDLMQILDIVAEYRIAEESK